LKEAAKELNYLAHLKTKIENRSKNPVVCGTNCTPFFNSKIVSQGNLKVLKISPFKNATTLNELLFCISFFSRIQNKNRKSNWTMWGHITAKTR
jgi:hypothetical protein